jgi:hypothetical protein
VVVNREADLLQVVAALRPPRRLPRCLHCRQQQGHQDANNRNDNQQLNESKATPAAASGPSLAAIHI